MDSIIWHGKSEERAYDLPDGITCVCTDPPYGVDFVSRRAETAEGKRWVRPVANDSDLAGAIDLFNEVMDIVLPKTEDNAELYVFTRWDIVAEWIAVVRGLERHGFSYKMLLVWDKGIPGMGDIDANWGCGHELILYCKKGRRDIPSRRSGIIAVDKVPAMHLIHPTEKPVALLKRLIEMSTDPGDLVVDPFSGSGSTIMAAQELGRVGIGIEKDDEHFKRSSSRLDQDAMNF